MKTRLNTALFIGGSTILISGLVVLQVGVAYYQGRIDARNELMLALQKIALDIQSKKEGE